MFIIVTLNLIEFADKPGPVDASISARVFPAAMQHCYEYVCFNIQYIKVNNRLCLPNHNNDSRRNELRGCSTIMAR